MVDHAGGYVSNGFGPCLNGRQVRVRMKEDLGREVVHASTTERYGVSSVSVALVPCQETPQCLQSRLIQPFGVL